MSSLGTGYDLGCNTYSPDGRIFQVEYASKAAENSGVAVGLKCKDGVILAVERLVQSQLLVKGANRRIMSVDPHIGLASAGILADGKHMARRAREEAQSFRSTYDSPISVKTLTERLGSFTHVYTNYGQARPFGISTILGGIDKSGPQLYVIEPAGSFFGYKASAVGKGRQLAKTELEKLNFAELDVRQGIKEVARIVHLVHDDSSASTTPFELEMTWIGPETQGKHQHVPEDLLREAEEEARRGIEAGMEED